MKINENSWHFRLVRFNSYYKARDLREYGGSFCSYFWSVVWAFLACTARFVLCLLIGWLFIYQPVSYLWAPTDEKLVMIILWVAAITIANLVGLMIFIKNKIPKKKKIENKEPNILVEYIRAKKQKFCPIIEIVKENK